MLTEITAVHPVLMARDVATSIACYARLGFVVDFQDDPTAPRYAVTRRGTVELHLQWADQSQWAHAAVDCPVYRFPTPDVNALYPEFVAAAAGGGHPQGGSTGPYAVPANTP